MWKGKVFDVYDSPSLGLNLNFKTGDKRVTGTLSTPRTTSRVLSVTWGLQEERVSPWLLTQGIWPWSRQVSILLGQRSNNTGEPLGSSRRIDFTAVCCSNYVGWMDRCWQGMNAVVAYLKVCFFREIEKNHEDSRQPGQVQSQMQVKSIAEHTTQLPRHVVIVCVLQAQPTASVVLKYWDQRHLAWKPLTVNRRRWEDDFKMVLQWWFIYFLDSKAWEWASGFYKTGSLKMRWLTISWQKSDVT